MDFDLSIYELPKIYERDGKDYLIDPIRKKFIKVTPEEKIRQQMVCFLKDQMGVPEDMIELEVPVSDYKKRSRDRMDIVVHAIENGVLVPVMIIECKSGPLLHDHLDQVKAYDSHLDSDRIILHNEKDCFMYVYDYDEQDYLEVVELPSYSQIIEGEDLEVFILDKPWASPQFSDIKKNCVLEEYKGVAIGIDTPKSLWKFVLNLHCLIRDDIYKIQPQVIGDIEIVEDIGTSIRSFGNASGDRIGGYYRKLIIKASDGRILLISIGQYALEKLVSDKRHGNQGGTSKLVVGIDYYDKKEKVEKTHHSIELTLDLNVSGYKCIYTITHDGKLSLGQKGSRSPAEVIDYVYSKKPDLIRNGKVFLGELDNSKQFIWDETSLQLLGRLIEYSLIRDEFRKRY